jgi:carboxypeptidase PM20D1
MEEIPVDRDRAVRHLQAMVRCQTISTPELRREEEFEKFRALLPEFYPRLFEKAEAERVESTGVLIRLPGRESGAPAVLLGHYDVVPAQESAWEKPPFEGILEDGVLWGRGTLDMKNQLCCMLEAIETLLAQGFTPKHDIYFALSGEEEIMGPSAPAMRDVLKNRGITPAFVLDEGGDILDRFFPGAPVPCAMVGVGEKGVANLWFRARSAGGHASTPNVDNPLPRLCRAMEKIEKHPFPQRLGPALEAMVDTMGRYCSFRTRLLLANRRVLRPLYLRWLKKQGGMIAAGSQTTFALTQAQGSQAGNVLPTEAAMFANLRLLWGDTQESVVRRLHKLIDDPKVEIEAHPGTDPRPDSAMTTGFDILQGAIEATWPQAVVTPYLMVACTDSRHWRDICDNVYRFSGKYVTGEEKATVHGNNERIRIENTENAVKFFFRLLREC